MSAIPLENHELFVSGAYSQGKFVKQFYNTANTEQEHAQKITSWYIKPADWFTFHNDQST